MVVVPAHPGSPGKRAIKWVCVCVFVFVSRYMLAFMQKSNLKQIDNVSCKTNCDVTCLSQTVMLLCGFV